VSELRWDPLKANWAIITEGRGRRPQDFLAPREKLAVSACPFCYGKEDKTPPEIYAYRPDGSKPNLPGWQVRVIPNKFPVLQIEGELDSQAHGLYDRMNGVGAHEIIIEHPDHERDMADLNGAEIAAVFKALRTRMIDLRNDMRFRYLFAFKNHGIEAATNVPHSHSQLIAVPLVPPMLSTELAICREYYGHKERCLVCDLLRQERQEKTRVVRDDGNILVYTPYASSFPFELRIAPLQHAHDFTSQSDQQLLALGDAMSDTLKRLRAVLRDPPYSFILHTAPPMHLRKGHPEYWNSLPFDYHWYIELAPKLTKVAGFEWGTGFHMNSTPPEEAAEFLRNADPELMR